jgi:hypothetical protein
MSAALPGASFSTWTPSSLDWAVLPIIFGVFFAFTWPIMVFFSLLVPIVVLLQCLAAYKVWGMLGRYVAKPNAKESVSKSSNNEGGNTAMPAQPKLQRRASIMDRIRQQSSSVNPFGMCHCAKFKSV